MSFLPRRRGGADGSARTARRIGLVLSIGLAASLLIGGVALADDLVVDGDGLTPVGASAMNLGDICSGQSKGGNALLAIAIRASSRSRSYRGRGGRARR